MAEEVGHVKQNWKDNQAKRSSCEVFQEVEEVFGGVSENLPELADCEDADIEDHKEADELDRNGAGEKSSRGSEPDPPRFGEPVWSGANGIVTSSRLLRR